MLYILIAHAIGFLIPVLLWPGLHIDENSAGAQALVLAVMFAVIGFAEYQIASSRQRGKIYFRGWVSAEDPRFVRCQLSYAGLSGFFMGAIVQVLI